MVDQREFVTAQRVSYWLPWYFKFKLRTWLTAPLFMLLAWAFAVSVFGSTIQGLALFAAADAVWGWRGLSLAIFVGWIPVILPPMLYYSLIKNTPGLWLRSDARVASKVIVSIGMLIALPLAAYLISEATGFGVSWIADRNPCASLEAGVSGSTPPVNCL